MSNIRELSQLASVINVNDETKNVGIGTTNPESKLSVGGDLTASGNITASSFYGDGSNLIGVSTFSGNYEDLTNKPETLSTVGLASEGYVDYKVGLSTSGLASVSYVNTSIVGFITSGALNGYATEEYVNNQGFVTSGIVVGFATEGYVNTSVANLVASAPETLNTLNELATALGNDANFSTTITNSLAGKANLTGANFTGIVTASSFSGPITGNVTGNAATATKLATARTIGGVSFDGSANINLPGVNTAGNQNTSGSAATLTTGRTIAITGDLTYTSGLFNGSENVTGTGTLATVNSNVGTFGSSTAIPSITVNAKGLVTGVTTNSITVGDGTLTLATSGTGLSGSASFTANQSSGSTFTVTSNATSANTASTLVSRDSSGNFIAGVITATSFSGNVTGNINSTGVSTFASLKATNINASGVTTSTGGFVGALSGNVTGNVTGNINSSGVSTFVSLRSTNINATGIITASSFIGNASSATYATTAGVSTSVIGGIGSITSLSVSGISTLQSTTLIGSGTSTGTASQTLQVTGGTYVSGSVGIGTTRPTTALSVVGVVSATGGFNLGISSSGASITSGPVTRLNFIGAGNTFAVNGSVVDVSISGGSAVSIGTIAPSSPSAGNLWYNSNLGRTFIYYNDGDSSQWVDAAPFNIGIIDRINVSGNGYILGNLGIGTTNPQKSLHIYTADGDIRLGDITEGTSTTDAGVIFTGLGSNTSAMFTEVNGTILSYGINCEQITGIETARAGGIFRLDTRTSGPYGDASCFVVKGRPIGSTTEYNAIVVGLNDGNTYLSPVRGNVLVGSATTTGTASQPLQVTGGAYVSGRIGIGTTNPQGSLHIFRQDTVSGIETHTDFILENPGIGNARFFLKTRDNNRNWEFFADDSDGSFGIYDGVAAARRFSILPVGNVLIGTSSSIGTGTTDQRLQVTGGAYVSGNLGVGATNPSYKLDVRGLTSIVNSQSQLLIHPNSNSSTVIHRNDGSDYYILLSNAGTTPDTTWNTLRPLSIVLATGRLNSNNGQYFTGTTLVGSASSTGTANQQLQVTGGAYVSGNIGVGTTNPSYKLHVVGSFGATTKSFIIDHPTKEGKKLQYGSLEGPENGVYVRGRTQSSIIELPDYWTGLVDEESITVNLTQIGESVTPRVNRVINNTVEIFSKDEGELDYYYTVFAERKDVAKLEVEF
jgi:hypothetical protein